MIKRYNMKTVLSDFGNDHGLKKIVESDDGEWIKLEDLIQAISDIKMWNSFVPFHGDSNEKLVFELRERLRI
jgi:hypothetical protein